MPDALTMNSSEDGPTGSISPAAILAAFRVFSPSAHALNAATNSAFEMESSGVNTPVALITALFFVYRYSTRKKINVLLDEKNKQLEELNSYKDKIFAIVSHDLRSPISSFNRITSALRMAIDYLSAEEIKRYITEIDTSATEF